MGKLLKEKVIDDADKIKSEVILVVNQALNGICYTLGGTKLLRKHIQN